jgi:hypothetical protein
MTSVFCTDKSTPDKYKFKLFDQKTKKYSEKRDTGDRCLNQAFNVTSSKSAHIKDRNAKRVTYGSADLQGFLFEDYTCIQPLRKNGSLVQQNETFASIGTKEEDLLNARCTPFEFLALYETRGFDKHFNGILGLSPKKSEKNKN